jgi:hypothetical protein
MFQGIIEDMRRFITVIRVNRDFGDKDYLCYYGYSGLIRLFGLFGLNIVIWVIRIIRV